MRLNNKENAAARMVVSIILILSFIVTNSMTAAAALSPQTISNASALTKYTTDLTQLGREGRLRENLSVEAETLRLADTLGEGGVRQPVIIDDTSESQTAIVELPGRVANICLLSNVDFDAAHRSYEKAGFERTGQCVTLFV